MKQVHLVLQGKGGVGKSMVSAMIAQYFNHIGEGIRCIDIDPVNSSFAAYKGLKVEQVDVMKGSEINTRAFDSMIELIASNERDVVIDSGASTFVPLANYLLTHDIAGLLSSLGYQLNIHTVITGGQALDDTVSGFYNLIKRFAKSVNFFVWLNPFWGEIMHEGKSFKEMKIYKQYQDRISHVIEIPNLHKDTFGYDFQKMLEKKKTFDEALSDSDIFLMTRQRLKMIQRDLFEQMEPALCQTDLAA